MSCFFCDSFLHLSHNCDIYISNEERKNVAQLKKCCIHCLNYGGSMTLYGCCKIKRKCYICFTKKHHTVYCPDRFKASGFFGPAIDQVLLPRFMKTLNLEERLQFAFSSPKLFAFVKSDYSISSLETLRITNESASVPLNYQGHCVVKYSTVFENLDFTNLPSLQLIPLKTFIFKLETITLKNFKILSLDFYFLLSWKTKDIFCENLEIVSSFKFSEILQRCPNIKNIYLNNTNIKIDSWPNDFCQQRTATYPLMLEYSFKDIDIDLKDFAFLVKSKPTSNFVIVLLGEAASYNTLNTYQSRINLKTNVLQYFMPVIPPDDMLILRIMFRKPDGTFDLFGNFMLNQKDL